jgi:sodium/bile acid cotransporter 7
MKKSDFFIPILLLAIILGKAFPEPALYEGVVNLKIISDIGIALVFLFYGIKLNLKQLKADLANWKLHLVIQFSTFVLFPLLVLPFALIFREHNTWLLWLGGFFLASLPSTVTSSVVLVSIAKGNVSSSIFNASVSSLAGIFITPLWIGLIITGQEVNAVGQGSIILKLILQVFMPVILGLFLNRYLGKMAEKWSSFLNTFDRSVIILIIYLSFAKSFYTNQFGLVKITDLCLTFLFCLILLFIVYRIITSVCKLLKFKREDIITAQFSGSQKSLIHGTVMSNVIFSGMSGIGVILLPLMIYHALQLIIMGIIAQRKANKNNKF